MPIHCDTCFIAPSGAIKSQLYRYRAVIMHWNLQWRKDWICNEGPEPPYYKFIYYNFLGISKRTALLTHNYLYLFWPLLLSVEFCSPLYYVSNGGSRSALAQPEAICSFPTFWKIAVPNINMQREFWCRPTVPLWISENRHRSTGNCETKPPEPEWGRSRPVSKLCALYNGFALKPEGATTRVILCTDEGVIRA